jgi:phosphatidylglycerophosphate synthase
MAGGLTLAEVQARTYKGRDSWWTVLLVDPLASRLVWLVARYPWVTPNRLTIAALILGCAAAAGFATATRTGLIVGAVLFHLSFVLDCMDGKVARLNGNGSIFGAWLDYILDRVRVLVCTIALMGGQYVATGQDIYLVLGGVIVFLDMFRYLDALQLGKTRKQMRMLLAAKVRELSGEPALAAHEMEADLENFSLSGDDEQQRSDVHPSVVVINTRPDLAMERDFRSRFRLFTRLRDTLIRSRIRAHLVSGIEFQMAVFIIAPLTGTMLVTPIVAGALLLIFEFALIYKLWLSSRSFARYYQRLETEGLAAVMPRQATSLESSSAPTRSGTDQVNAPAGNLP